MLALDSEAQRRWRLETNKESLTERRQRMLADDLKSNTVTVEPDGGRDVSNLLAQMGKPMSAQQLIERLRRCNPRLVFERAPAYPNLYGIYVTTHEKTAAGTWMEKKAHICGMEAGIMPEFSVLHKKKIRVPNRELFGAAKPTREVDWTEIETFADETRGWRTVLIRLLHANLITRGDVQKHFGWEPSRDSRKWHEQTR